MCTIRILAMIAVLTSILPVSAPASQPVIRLSVKESKNSDTDSSNKKSTQTKKTTETYQLDVNLINSGTDSVSVDLEWYIFATDMSQKTDSEPYLYDKGSKTFSFAQNEKGTHSVSVNFESEEQITHPNTGKSKSGGKVKKQETGSEFYGYIILVRCNGEIVKKQASKRTLEKEETIEKLSSMQVKSEKAKGDKNKTNKSGKSEKKK